MRCQENLSGELMMRSQVPEHLHAISKHMKGFQSMKHKFWQLQMLPIKIIKNQYD